MAVDTSWEAVERLAQGVMAPDYLAPTKATVANTLRALLARAEAAEADITRLYDCLNTEANLRDAAIAERDRLAEAFSAIEAECWDVRCIDVPTGCGDADVQWVVIAHYMAAPKEREVGHGTSPLSAIQAALAFIKKEPTDGE